MLVEGALKCFLDARECFLEEPYYPRAFPSVVLLFIPFIILIIAVILLILMRLLNKRVLLGIRTTASVSRIGLQLTSIVLSIFFIDLLYNNVHVTRRMLKKIMLALKHHLTLTLFYLHSVLNLDELLLMKIISRVLWKPTTRIIMLSERDQ